MKKILTFIFIFNISCNLAPKVSKIKEGEYHGFKGDSLTIKGNYMGDAPVKIKIWHSKTQKNYKDIKSIDVVPTKFFSYEEEITFKSLNLSSSESNYIYTSIHNSWGVEITASNEICWGTGC